MQKKEITLLVLDVVVVAVCPFGFVLGPGGGAFFRTQLFAFDVVKQRVVLVFLNVTVMN